jgi:hypothetical protein
VGEGGHHRRNEASQSLRDPRLAEVAQLDRQIENG